MSRSPYLRRDLNRTLVADVPRPGRAYSAYRSRSLASQSAFISSPSFDLYDDFAAAAPCPPVFVGSRGILKGEHLRHLDP